MEFETPQEGQENKKQNIALKVIVPAVMVILAVLGIVAVLAFGAEYRLIPAYRQDMAMEYGQTWRDPGVHGILSVFSVDIPVSAQVSVEGLVEDELGEYVLSYHSKFLFWTAETKRTVCVVDSNGPKITLKYDEENHTLPGYAYKEDGFSATDNYDGDITDRVQRIDEGDSILYRVTDSSGNTTEVRRKITYYREEAPVLKLEGDKTVHVDAGHQFVDPGFAALDIVDGDISGTVTVSGDYDIYIPGNYTISYSVTDSDGNTTRVLRKLVVDLVRQTDTEPTDGKVIYLTFDDGPSEYVPYLLEILDKYNVKATFFVIGSGDHSLLKQMAEAGHAIGNHTYSHKYSKVYTDVDSFFVNLQMMEDIIYQKTGIRTKLIRFPGGSSNTISRNYSKGIMTKLAAEAEKRGYTYIDWNVSSGDAGSTKTTDYIFHSVISQVSKRKASIVLQHDDRKYSVEAVEKIITWGLANGYTFLPLDENSPTAHHKIAN